MLRREFDAWKEMRILVLLCDHGPLYTSTLWYYGVSDPDGTLLTLEDEGRVVRGPHGLWDLAADERVVREAIRERADREQERVDAEPPPPINVPPMRSLSFNCIHCGGTGCGACNMTGYAGVCVSAWDTPGLAKRADEVLTERGA